MRLIRAHAGVPDALRSHQTANGAKAVEIPSRPLLAPLNAQLLEFPHGLQEFCTANRFNDIKGLWGAEIRSKSPLSAHLKRPRWRSATTGLRRYRTYFDAYSAVMRPASSSNARRSRQESLDRQSTIRSAARSPQLRVDRVRRRDKLDRFCPQRSELNLSRGTDRSLCRRGNDISPEYTHLTRSSR